MPQQTSLSDMSRNNPSNDYHQLPVSDKQLRFARAIAARAALNLPSDVLQDRRAMSAWIDAHAHKQTRSGPDFSRQVAFAERIARIKRRQVPRECFQDMGLMSRWIDSNR